MFRTSLPATDDTFFDREEELARLESVVADLQRGEPRWLAIVGRRKVGKTSLVLEIARRHRDAALAFLVLDVTDSLPLSLEFFRGYAAAALDAALGREVGLSLARLVGRPAAYRSTLQRAPRFPALGPELRGLLLELPDRRMDEGMVRVCLDLPELLAEQLDLRFVAAIDEFQELADLSSRRGGADPLPMMRSVWQRHRRVTYLVSGSGRTMLTRMVTEAHSPFFQHFALLPLEPFAPAAALRLLTGAAPPGRTVPPALAERAIAALGTHPFYLQLLGETLTADDPPYGDAELKAALQALLFSRTGRLALYFEGEFQRLVGRSTYLAGLLTALAEGPARLTDVAAAIGATSGAAANYLERLGDAVRREEDGRYALDDGVFGLWLRWRRPGGTVVPMTVIGTEAELRAAEHLSQAGFELVYASRASRGPFDLLATRGGAQLGVQVKRSAPPLRFRKTEWARMRAAAESQGWAWLIAQVAPDGRVRLLDPDKARRGREIRLDEGAEIENVLAWLAAHGRGAVPARARRR
ncbi:MAG: ATP-binding protein [Gemmatimonadales bacterium]|jgi:AAA+ ATPase superfamily predicted ATPase|nr:ATP-binding protein [Gemmatimonadales bacterium]